MVDFWCAEELSLSHPESPSACPGVSMSGTAVSAHAGMSSTGMGRSAASASGPGLEVSVGLEDDEGDGEPAEAVGPAVHPARATPAIRSAPAAVTRLMAMPP